MKGGVSTMRSCYMYSCQDGVIPLCLVLVKHTLDITMPVPLVWGIRMGMWIGMRGVDREGGVDGDVESGMGVRMVMRMLGWRCGSRWGWGWRW